jgi:hypothetical protein
MNKSVPVKFQNRKNTMTIWVNKFVMTLIFTIMIVFTGFTKWFDEPVLGIERVHWIVIIVAVWLLFVFLQGLRRPCYIYFEDTGDKLIIRYYPLKILNQKKNSIEIPKKDFIKFTTEKFFFRKYEKIILYQKFKKGIAKYPPISLSAVNKNDIAKIKTLLGQYIQPR